MNVCCTVSILLVMSVGLWWCLYIPEVKKLQSWDDKYVRLPIHHSDDRHDIGPIGWVDHHKVTPPDEPEDPTFFQEQLSTFIDTYNFAHELQKFEEASAAFWAEYDGFYLTQKGEVESGEWDTSTVFTTVSSTFETITPVNHRYEFQKTDTERIGKFSWDISNVKCYAVVMTNDTWITFVQQCDESYTSLPHPRTCDDYHTVIPRHIWELFASQSTVSFHHTAVYPNEEYNYSYGILEKECFLQLPR